MKKIRIFTVMSVIALNALFGASAFGQEALTDDAKSQSIIISGLQIYLEDLPDYTLTEAQAACARKNEINSQGHNDWRIPTIVELEVMYEHRNEITGLKDGLYLSNHQWNTHGQRRGPFGIGPRRHIWHGNYFDFSTGKLVQKDRHPFKGHVRLVRGQYAVTVIIEENH